MQVIILGMHRSGTSMLAGIISKMGVFLGDDLIMGTTPINPMGYYEDREFVELNGEILRDAGGGWERPPHIESIKHVGEKRKDDIKALIKKRDTGTRGDPGWSVWGWKDPRTCLTLPVYLPYLSNPKIIVINRDREAVTASLLKRENRNRERMAHHEAVQLVSDYNNAIISNAVGTQFFIVSYEQLIATQDTRPIARYLGLPYDWASVSQANNHIKPEYNRCGNKSND